MTSLSLRCLVAGGYSHEATHWRRKRQCRAIVPYGFAAALPPHRGADPQEACPMNTPPRRTPAKRPARSPAHLLRDALAAYGLNRRRLRELASQGTADLRAALREP